MEIVENGMQEEEPSVVICYVATVFSEWII